MSEELFRQACINNGFEFEKSSREQDMFQHIDAFVTGNEKTFSVDIKGLKRVNRRDRDFVFDLIWVELQNVRGNTGWLYGDADFIAFESMDSFVFVERKKLVDFVEKNVKLDDIRSDKKPYSIYSRKGRKDKVTLIKWKDLEKQAGSFYKLSKL